MYRFSWHYTFLSSYRFHYHIFTYQPHTRQHRNIIYSWFNSKQKENDRSCCVEWTTGQKIGKINYALGFHSLYSSCNSSSKDNYYTNNIVKYQTRSPDLSLETYDIRKMFIFHDSIPVCKLFNSRKDKNVKKLWKMLPDKLNVVEI